MSDGEDLLDSVGLSGGGQATDTPPPGSQEAKNAQNDGEEQKKGESHNDKEDQENLIVEKKEEEKEKKEGGKEKSHLMADLFGGSDEDEEDSDVELFPPTVNPPLSPSFDNEKQNKGGEGASDKKKAEDELIVGNDEDMVNWDEEPTAPKEPAFIEIEGAVLHSNPYPRPSESTKLVFVKPPNPLAFQPKGFDEHVYDGSDQKPEVIYDAQNKQRMKRQILDTVRWREKTEGGVVVGRESNSRLVTFSDGKRFLFVGKSAYKIAETSFKDHHCLFVQQKSTPEAPSFLESHGIINEKFRLMPTNIFASQNTTLTNRLKTYNTNKGRSRIKTGGELDVSKDKAAKEVIEDSKGRLRRDFAIQDVGQTGITEEFLENDDLDLDDAARPLSRNVDREKEKAYESRVMAAKRGEVNDEEEGEKDLLSDSIFDEDDEIDLVDDDLGDGDSSQPPFKKRKTD